nr:hypothetical protein [Tanacetum cinerariifolium]
TYKEALTQACWIEAMEEELYEFECLEEEGIDFEESFPLHARLEAIRIFLAYAAHKNMNPRGIFINQSKYALEALKKYGFESCDPMDTPMVEKSKLDEDREGKDVDPLQYRGMIGTLLYLTASRPDLQFAICMCARYQARPTKKHDSSVALTAFADADHASCQDTRRSTSGNCNPVFILKASIPSKRKLDLTTGINFLSTEAKSECQKEKGGSDSSTTLPTAVAYPRPITTVATASRLTVAAKGKQPARATSPNDPSEIERTEAEQLKIVLRMSRQETHISQYGGSSIDEGTGSKPGVPDVPFDDSEEEISWNSFDDEDVRLNVPVRRIRTDNGTEFVNQTLRDYYEEVGISHETSVARSPQQNGVVERQAVATACFTQNRSIIRLRHEKTPYELMHGKQPDLSYFHVFGALCYPTNDDFDELTAMASEQSSSGPALQEMTPATISSGLVDDDSTSSPSSTEVDQDAPSLSQTPTPTEIQSSVIPQDVGNENLDIEVAHMGNDPLPGVPITEVASGQSSLTASLQTNQESSSVSSFVTSMLNSISDAVFRFKDRVKSLEVNFLEFMQTNQFAEAVSNIPDRLQDSFQRENDEFLRTIDENMKKIIKGQVKSQVKEQVSRILPRIEESVNAQLEAEVLTRSSHSSRTSYAVAADLTEMELKKILIKKMEGNKSIQRSGKQRNLYKALVDAYEADKTILESYGDTSILKRSREDDDDQEGPSAGSDRGSKRRREGGEPESASTPSEPATRSASRSTTGTQSRQMSASESAFTEEPVQTTCQMDEHPHPVIETRAEDQPIISKLAKQADSRSSFNELLDTPIDFSNFIMNRLGVDTLTLELLAGPTYELMRGSCTSLTELEYHLEEVYKATTDQFDWVNLEGQQYPHNMLQPLSLIPNNRGRRVILFAHFINNDLEYLRGGALSRKYTTSVTKTKAADYGHIKWIEDLFYGFAINWESALDVYSKRRIIAVTDLKIVEWHNYKHLDWISDVYTEYRHPTACGRSSTGSQKLPEEAQPYQARHPRRPPLSDRDWNKTLPAAQGDTQS